jgi:hypothetical protein
MQLGFPQETLLFEIHANYLGHQALQFPGRGVPIRDQNSVQPRDEFFALFQTKMNFLEKGFSPGKEDNGIRVHQAGLKGLAEKRGRFLVSKRIEATSLFTKMTE